MKTKLAADLRIGDVVDLTGVTSFDPAVRTVRRIEWNDHNQVRVFWAEMARPNVLAPDKELTISTGEGA